MDDAQKIAGQTRVALAYQNVANADARRQSRDGVVVTPVEVVDFQIRSAIEILKDRYDRDPDEGIEWLDPFGGTGIYTARLLQIAQLPPHRKRTLASHCIVLEIDPTAAQFAADNLAEVYRQEIGEPGAIRVVCADTFGLPPNADLWDASLPVVHPRNIFTKGAQA